MKRYKKALFIFHRDLRLSDNTGLAAALHQSEQVVPVFIFDQIQVGQGNTYRSNAAVQFMFESLADLDAALNKKRGHLFCFEGHTQQVVKKLLTQHHVDAIFSNRDYTPFARKRDEQLAKIAKAHGVGLVMHDDALLCNPDTLLTGKGTPYTIYGAFLKKAVQQKVAEPAGLVKGTFFMGQLAGSLSLALCKKQYGVPDRALAETGGSQAAHRILKKLADFKKYTAMRDYPVQKTTRLSAHLKFGTVSAREVYHAVKEHKADATLLKQLYWRDFFTYIAYHFPHVFGHAFVKKYEHVTWKENKQWFKQWCEGKTGFPIVDAGMRELNETGYMHNRVRMIVASFLTKDMHIDWRLGERYFAQHLVDYDPCVNNGNWQWSASTGADAQPYFRIFNPWLQQKKFDADCQYIKTWVPELSDLSAREIHNWFKAKAPHKGYPLPVLDHAVQAPKAKAMFSRL